MIIRPSAGFYFTMAAVFGIGAFGMLVGGVCAAAMSDFVEAVAALAVSALGVVVVIGCIKRGKAFRNAGGLTS